jgi:hypothetical protein
MFFNAYLMKIVYFGYGIVEINERQEKYLQSLYETIILNKLMLSEKFPRRILYVRRNTIGIGFIRPKTVINALATKLYIGHQQANTSTSNMIQAIIRKSILKKV